MKTITRIRFLVLIIQFTGCASSLKNMETTTQRIENSNDTKPNLNQTLAESFAVGLGSGLGWGIGTSLTKNW